VTKAWLDCNDSNPCTDDSFDPVAGLCLHTANSVCVGKVTGGGEINVPGGTSNFGFVAQRKTNGGAVTGQVEYYNHARGLNVHSVSIQTLNVYGTTATFTGTCQKNGSPCTF